MIEFVRILAIAAVAVLSGTTVSQAQVIPQPVPQVVPQFNDPGPQIVIPPPGNPVKQLSPIESTRPPGVGRTSVLRHTGHRHARVARRARP
jgi:hypothetical protein